MVRPKKRAPKPAAPNHINGVRTNGVAMPPRGPSQVMAQYPGKPIPPVVRPSPQLPSSLALLEGSDLKVSGFSDDRINANYHDYPLVTTKRALMQGLRYHVLRFATKRPVDPTDERQFLRPVRLHRRDPRFNPGDAGNGETVENEEEKEEREKREKAKEEREKLKEADALLIAPSADKPVQRKVPFGKRVQPVYRNNQTEAQKAQSKLKYEETLPWHLEDDENKNSWIGNYEQALSGEYAAFALGADNKFRMIPIEKWYRFAPKNKFKTLTIEEAEKKMGAKVKKDKWAIEAQEKERERKEHADHRDKARKLFTGRIGSMGGGLGGPNMKTESDQVDDLDFEEDRFADDEEAPFMEGVVDAEEKETENKIKREQLEANIFDMRDEKDYDREEQEQQRVKRMMKETGKKVKKTIVKREKNYMYDSGSENPYSSSDVRSYPIYLVSITTDSGQSESEDTATELLKEEERKKEAERKANASDQEKAKKSKAPSEASTRGTNTPSGRLSKHPLPSASSKSLKRPGSPNISEASGNESSRKKHRKFDGKAASQPIQPPSRPTSPNLLPPSSSAPDGVRPAISRNPSSFSRHPRSNAGSGSEGEAAGSGGEMSDGARRKQTLKLNMGSKKGTPQGSRAGSPDRGGAPAAAAAAAAVRTGTPGMFGHSPNIIAWLREIPYADNLTVAVNANANVNVNANNGFSSSSSIEPPLPTAEELRAMIPPQGLTLNELLIAFGIKKGVDGDRKAQFTKLMRANSRWDSSSKLLYPLH